PCPALRDALPICRAGVRTGGDGAAHHGAESLTMADVLEIRGLTKHFGGFAALADVSFTVRQGTLHSIIGPNGAGKTTLFNLLSGVLNPTAGKILLLGRD